MNLGDKVILTREKSVRHFENAPFEPMPITGRIVKRDPTHYQGKHNRAYLIKFDDGRESWYAGWEFRTIKEENKS